MGGKNRDDGGTGALVRHLLRSALSCNLNLITRDGHLSLGLSFHILVIRDDVSRMPTYLCVLTGMASTTPPASHPG